MAMTTERRIFGLKPDTLFQAFKYSIYFLIFLNVFYWLYEDYTASGHTFRNGISWSNLGDAFAASIDTIAWFILLMTLELETYVLSDERLKGKIKWFLGAISIVCYFFIVVAFTGYFEKMSMTYGFKPSDQISACENIGSIPSYAIELDDYAELTEQSCSNLNAPFYINTTVGMIAEESVLREMHRLSATDVVNSATWILIVLVLWLDVFFQLRGGLTQKLYHINVGVKVLLYGSLLVACFYWGWLGDEIGFWDALLWILAFFFIELNLFQWQEEIAENKAEAKA